MNLDAKISAAVRCLEREYRGTLDQAMLDYMVADIRREHRRQMRQAFTRGFQAVLRRVGRLFVRQAAARNVGGEDGRAVISSNILH